ncbi:putative membrane protein [Ceratocystis platani]|uniref:Putative membrane protein n=1 Tax=Ceratocystis fimbriata f. sp. platani TaxID=88771 RepID=A0A0F8DKG0_CERFI|nr:putative membrane protein [Ceratocystis platani]
MRDPAVHRARLVASAAATMISLACGTNYVYSGWAPQFADRLKLSVTQINLIGTCGNLGMYAVGIPIGIFIDSRGPRPAVLLGAACLLAGYYPLHNAYDSGSGSLWALCLYSFLTGVGGCMAFAAAVKTSAINWPHHRGTATAFPLAAFGLSAFFFSLLSAVVAPGDPSGFLYLLAVGTFGMTTVGFFFLQSHGARHRYDDTALPGMSTSSPDASPTTSISGGVTPLLSRSDLDISLDSTSSSNNDGAAHSASCSEGDGDDNDDDDDNGGSNTSGANHHRNSETASLISQSSEVSSFPGEILVQNNVDMGRSHRVDIRGLQLLHQPEFWQLFVILGLLAGIGLMTINNIGHDVISLWRAYDDSVDHSFLVTRQQLHVSILSICSFTGRLLSGVGSDFLVKVLNASRNWCLVVASVVFSLAQLSALYISNPHLLGLVSGLSGLGYGFLFGVYPSIVAESFGIHGLSQNWGVMTLAPVASGNVFNMFYGMVYDAHSARLVLTTLVIRQEHRMGGKESKGRTVE